MRIPSDKPSYIELPRAREKPSTDGTARSGDAAASTPTRAEGAQPSASLDRTVLEADVASREFEQSIAARLDQVREQLRGGTYAIDYDRLAQRMADEGFGS
jgi:anti-sigma28 factor (negative regulator of flagellin synthesis)